MLHKLIVGVLSVPVDFFPGLASPKLILSKKESFDII